tara:strand:+ start:71 stop:505 length:435 start_codon:yes stop_codon:yes gene_type:complete
MKKNNFLIKIFLAYALSISSAQALKSEYFNKGKSFFDKKDFENSKVFFEKDIVFNPKSENSYLYLAKIFNIKENEEEEEMNLQNVLILNPKNDEAIYMLINLKIKQSDYDEADDLIKKFELVCKNFCSKKEEILKKFNKLIPNE